MEGGAGFSLRVFGACKDGPPQAWRCGFDPWQDQNRQAEARPT
jgi:hypothetical protein